MSITKLEQYDEFKEILDTYKADQDALKLLNDVPLVVISSITSAGKNTLINALVATGAYEFVRSDTTRPPRINNGVSEENGVEYFFKSEQEFLECLKNKEYIEAKLIHGRQVSGTSFKRIKDAIGSGKILVIEADYQGAADIHALKPDAHNIFVLPPTYEIWMERLQNRGFISQDEFRSRLFSAEKEIEVAIKNKFYKIVINNEVEQTAPEVRKIVENGEYTDAQRHSAEEIAWKLLNNIKETLGS